MFSIWSIGEERATVVIFLEAQTQPWLPCSLLNFQTRASSFPTPHFCRAKCFSSRKMRMMTKQWNLPHIPAPAIGSLWPWLWFKARTLSSVIRFSCSNESLLVLVSLVEGSLTSTEGEDRGVPFYPFLRWLNPYRMSVLGFIDSTIALAALVANDIGEAEPCMAQVPRQKTSPSQRMLLSILIELGRAIGVRLMFGACVVMLFVLLGRGGVIGVRLMSGTLLLPLIFVIWFGGLYWGDLIAYCWRF